MSVPYVWVPNIETPILGDISNWLEIGYNTPGRDAWIAAINNHIVKAAYYGTGGGYYYIASMCELVTGSSRYVLSGQEYEGGVYNFSPSTNWNFSYNMDGPHRRVSGIGQILASQLNLSIPIYSSASDAYTAMDDGNWDGPVLSYPITYRLINATTIGPNEAAVGDTVTVPLTFPEGYGVVNPASDAYVTCNGVLVPSTYSNGQLVFTMPDPS